MTEGGSALLAFSTLACPEWDAETVIRPCRGARVRGRRVAGRPRRDGPDHLAGGPARRGSGARWPTAGIAAIAVTAYSELISGDPAIRSASVDGLVRHAELASDLGAATVRVFLGVADDGASAGELEHRAVDALATALDRTDRGITLAIEPHDGHVRAETVAPILAALPEPRLGVVWDIANAWSAGEAPETGLAAYAGRIAYVQLKDGTGGGSSWRLTALGTGDVPLARALGGLDAARRGRDLPFPPLSVEWERAWHPELAPADEALPAARRWLVDVLAGLRDGAAVRSEGAT